MYFPSSGVRNEKEGVLQEFRTEMRNQNQRKEYQTGEQGVESQYRKYRVVDQ